MYTITDLAEMTGLTDRTLRNYLNAGFLQGTKADGKWQFTAEQFGAFLRHEAVKPALEAKRNSLVFDFMADAKKPEDSACLLLDLVPADADRLAVFFCGSVNRREGMHLAFRGENDRARVILTGRAGDVLEVLNEYQNI